MATPEEFAAAGLYDPEAAGSTVNLASRLVKVAIPGRSSRQPTPPVGSPTVCFW